MHAALGWRERGGAPHGMAQWQGYTRLRQAALRCVLPACCYHQCRGCCQQAHECQHEEALCLVSHRRGGTQGIDTCVRQGQAPAVCCIQLCAAHTMAEIAGKVIIKHCIERPCSMDMRFPDKPQGKYNNIWQVVRYLCVRSAGLCAAAAGPACCTGQAAVCSGAAGAHGSSV